jgi:hypothetical protein
MCNIFIIKNALVRHKFEKITKPLQVSSGENEYFYEKKKINLKAEAKSFLENLNFMEKTN